VRTRALLPACVALVLAATPLVSQGAAPAPRIENPVVIKSFDGAPIVATFMLPAGASATAPVPAVLRTHGWGGSRETSPAGITKRLLDSGYAVLTWDSRGFGESGGEANVGSPGFEVRDAQTLISWLAGRPEVLRDGHLDPRVGWTGGSNAAGVQLNTAAVDRRIDAIVPEISWGDLVQDLTPNAVPKQTWDAALYGVGAAGAGPQGLRSAAGPQTGVYAKEIHQGFAEIAATGSTSEVTSAWFAHKSTTSRSRSIQAPTLIIQGSIDTLFPLEDAFANYRNIAAGGAPVKLMTYCSGHTIAGCSYPGGASGYPTGADGRPAVFEDRIVAWLDRYVKGIPVSTGAPVEWQAQDGTYRPGVAWPLPGTRPTSGLVMRTGALVGPGRTGGDGAADGNPAPADELGSVAARSVVYGPATQALPLLGVPTVKLTGTVTGVQGHVFLELVDVAPDGTRVTLDDQTMPVRLAGGAVDRTVALHGVSWLLPPGHKLELEITTGSAQYAASRLGPYSVDLTAVTTLPLTFPLPPPPPCRGNHGRGQGKGPCAKH
jgi:ABC-2 type transport system ATP-binding protein